MQAAYHPVNWAAHANSAREVRVMKVTRVQEPQLFEARCVKDGTLLILRRDQLFTNPKEAMRRSFTDAHG